MRNYKASCSESPCVGMNRKICLSLFPHRPLAFHGLTFADGGRVAVDASSDFHGEVFQPWLCQGWDEKGERGMEGDQAEAPKGLFSPG